MKNSTVTITKGDGFTAISFENPIEYLKEYAYNGTVLLTALDGTEVKTFWDKGQIIDIYNDRQLVCSCRVTEVKIKNRWRKVILDAWDKHGKIFDYELEYRRLLDALFVEHSISKNRGNGGSLDNLKENIITTISEIQAKTEEYNAVKDEKIFWQDVTDSDSYRLALLSGYSRRLHKPYDEYLQNREMFVTDNNNSDSGEDYNWINDL